jgi:hypothetical protein
MGVKFQESFNVRTPKAQNRFPVAQADHGKWWLASAGYVIPHPCFGYAQLPSHVFSREKAVELLLDRTDQFRVVFRVSHP